MRRIVALLTVGFLAAAGCGNNDDGGAIVEPTAATGGTDATTTIAAPTGDPIAAAEAFIATFMPGSTATLSEFRQGDPQSGEVEVFRPAEGGGTGPSASTLLLRFENGAFQVVGAVSPSVTIEEPGGGVEAGPQLQVRGVGRGFEATLVARAFEADGTMVAEAVGTGGALADPEPYEITLDLSAVAAGTPLVVIVAGGTGLEGDPGEFSAVRVVRSA